MVDNIEESDFIVELSLFSSDSYLNHLFKPISSLNQINNFEYFIALSKEVLEYLEESQGLLAIYNKDRHILLAQHEFSLLNLLINC